MTQIRIVIGHDSDPDWDEHVCAAPKPGETSSSMDIERRNGQWQIADSYSSNLGPIYVEIPITYCPFCGVELAHV